MKSLYLPALLTVAVAAPSSADVFRWVAMPDAQFYADAQIQDVFPFASSTTGTVVTDPRGTAAIYHDITQWIVDRNADADPDNDIHYVQQLGDLTQNGNDSREWDISKSAMDKLAEADIVFGVAEGNHDCYFDFDNCQDDPNREKYGAEDENGAPLSGSYHTNFLKFFGPDSVHAGTAFREQPWYRSSPSGASNAQLLEFDGHKLGFINLSIGNPQAEVDWAIELIEAEPDRIFVLGAHMLNYDAAFLAGRETEVVSAPALGIPPTPFFPRTFEPFPLYVAGDPVDTSDPANLGVEIFTYTATGEMGNFGQNVFDELTSRYPNVLMVHSGHNCGEYLRADGTNGAGNPVIEVLTDYQCALNGGDGWTRVYEFDFDSGELRYYTVSPRQGFANDAIVGPRPADGFDTPRRTKMDAFVDYLHFLYAFILPEAIANFPEALEALGGLTDDEVAFLKANALYESTLEEIFVAALGPLDPDSATPSLLFALEEFDDPAERAYYQAKLNVRFGGTDTVDRVPALWSDIGHFERAWLSFFSEDEGGVALQTGDLVTWQSCNDPTTGGALNRFNRCPEGAVPVDFSRYRVLSTAATVPMVPAALGAGLALIVGFIGYRRRPDAD